MPCTIIADSVHAALGAYGSSFHSSPALMEYSPCPAFSNPDLIALGLANAHSLISTSHGASWGMVVEVVCKSSYTSPSPYHLECSNSLTTSTLDLKILMELYVLENGFLVNLRYIVFELLIQVKKYWKFYNLTLCQSRHVYIN